MSSGILFSIYLLGMLTGIYFLVKRKSFTNVFTSKSMTMIIILTTLAVLVWGFLLLVGSVAYITYSFISGIDR